MSSVEPNEDNIRAVFEEAAHRIESVDFQLREEWLGHRASGIQPVAQEAFAAIGITLSGDELAKYAASVERGEPFTFQLG